MGSSERSPRINCALLDLHPESSKHVSLPRMPYYNKSSFRNSSWQGVQLVEDEVWDSAFRRVTGNLTLLQKMLLRLHANMTVNIQVRGGSMTFGVGCDSRTEADHGLANINCAWPSFLARHLRLAFPGATVELDNRAKRGCDELCDYPDWISSLAGETKAPDLLIFDYTQNGEDSPERLARTSRFLLPNTQILYVWNGFRNKKPRTRSDAARRSSLHIAAKVLQLYGIPLASFFDAEDAYYDMHGHRYGVLWNETLERHPRWHTHAHIADMIVRLLNLELAKLESCNLEAISSSRESLPKSSQPFVFHPKDMAEYRDPIPAIDRKLTNLAALDVCFVPIAYHNAYAPGNSSPASSIHGAWQLFEDRPKKPGWIAKSTEEWLEFPVSFGKHPKLMVSYLRTYDQLFGSIEVKLGHKVLDRISAVWPEKVSVTHQKTYQDKKLDGVKPHQSYLLSVRMVQGKKFKLIAVMSC